jgi:hypothetical protein
VATRPQHWGRRQRDVHWLMTYALGLAFSEPSDIAACDQLLTVTEDHGMLSEARARLAAATVADPETRRRAEQLLNRAARSVRTSVSVGSLAVRRA